MRWQAVLLATGLLTANAVAQPEPLPGNEEERSCVLASVDEILRTELGRFAIRATRIRRFTATELIDRPEWVRFAYRVELDTTRLTPPATYSFGCTLRDGLPPDAQRLRIPRSHPVLH
jgi:hypothetical protein